MTTENHPCQRCGGRGQRLRWQVFADARRHIRASCGHCGAFLCYLEQTPQNKALADRAPAAAVQRGLWD
jgi:hypothetical protein